MKELIESKVFCDGVAVGINLHQQKVIDASEHKEPLRINGELYYVLKSRERFNEMINKICK